jgi:hypothetical protein
LTELSQLVELTSQFRKSIPHAWQEEERGHPPGDPQVRRGGLLRAALSRGAHRRDQHPPADWQGHAVPLLQLQGRAVLRQHRRWARGLQGAIDETLGRNEPSENIIEALARTIIGYFWERRDFFVLLYRHEAKLDASERAEWQKGRELLVSTVGQRLADELDRDDIDPRLAVEMLFGMIRAVCLYRDETARMDDLAKLVTRLFLTGVRGAPRRGEKVRHAVG